MWKISLCDFYRMCLLNVSVSYKLVSCCLIVIKCSIRVKLLRLAVTSYFADDCFMSIAFQYRFPTQKPSKVSLRLLCMLSRYFYISPERVCSSSSLTDTDFTSVEKTVVRTLLPMFTK